MPTIVKIKILDDIHLRTDLDNLYELASQIEMCQYSLYLCSHTLSLILLDHATSNIVLECIKIFKLFLQGKTSMQEVRQASFKIHAHAKAQDDMIKQTGLRVIGHAIATAHMKEHAMVASDYAIKVDNTLNNSNHHSATTLRRWQIETLTHVLNAK